MIKKPQIKASADVIRKALLQEFETFLYKNKIHFEKEVMYKKLFDTKRQFRADYVLNKISNGVINELFITVEINGGQFINGRHTRGGKGYETDLQKINLAQRNDYKVFQYTYEMLKRREYLEDFRQII